MTTQAPIALEEIRAAAAVIKGKVERTRLSYSRTLSQIAGAEIFLKFENHQFTASFKERGALYRLAALSPQQRQRGIIAVSAGNHAQGVAYHANQLQIPATIVMPIATPFVKVSHTEAFGATVLLQGENLSQSARYAEDYCQKHQLTFIHPYEDARLIAGQGTIGLELFEDRPDLEMVVVPVGGGGLLAGIASALNGLGSKAKLIGVESRAYPSLYNALYGRSLPSGGVTVAEGIAVKSVGALNLAIIGPLLSEALLVDEQSLEAAINLLVSVEKTVVEGAGAAALAAVLANRELFNGKRTALILSGGNIDSRLLATILTRGLVKEGRIARLRIEINDSPGSLAKIAGLIADGGGNIIDVAHQRLFAHVPVKSAHLDVALETRDAAHIEKISARIREAGFLVEQLDDTH